jgi:hypothetical protein
MGCIRSGMRFLPLHLALACVAVFAVLEALTRFRLRKVGEQSRPFQGACLTTQSIADYEGGTAGLDGQFI